MHICWFDGVNLWIPLYRYCHGQRFTGNNKKISSWCFHLFVVHCDLITTLRDIWLIHLDWWIIKVKTLMAGSRICTQSQTNVLLSFSQLLNSVLSAETISKKMKYVKKFHIKLKTWYFSMMLCIICVGESFGEQDPGWQTLWLQSINRTQLKMQWKHDTKMQLKEENNIFI